ncbi:MAG: AMP-binding protein [bacterium]|nr:AMP-binding protein [bacterium]
MNAPHNNSAGSGGLSPSQIDCLTPRAASFFERIQRDDAPLFQIAGANADDAEPVIARVFARQCAQWAALIQRMDEPVTPIFGHTAVSMMAAWLGSAWAGKLPVFLSFPNHKISPEDYALKLKNYQNQFKNSFFIGLEEDRSFCPNLIVPEDLPTRLAGDEHFTPSSFDPDSPLFLQCSSGSTGLQKAVAITPRMLETQLECYARWIGLSSERDRIVSWLPLYHDMGLIAAFLMPLLTGTPVTFLDTFEWAANPGLLLKWIERDRSTLCWLPNFAFSFLCRAPVKCGLSSMRCFINCSEPAFENAFERFARQYSVARDRFAVCYALAENVFAVSQTPSGRPPGLLRIKREAFQRNRVEPGEAETRAIGEETALADDEMEIMSCGPIIGGVEVRIGARDGEDVGEVLLRGPACITRYLGQPPARDDGWTPTGDLGFIHDGELYLCGRIKDLIIHNGKNIYPQDLEDVLNQHPAVYKGRVAALGWFDEEAGSEKILALFEPSRFMTLAEKRTVCEELRRRLNTLFDIRSEVVCVPRQWLKKTSSGKIARQANLQHYLDRRDQSVHVVGDSHSRILWVNRYSHQNYYKRISAYWAGVLWADNCTQFLPLVEKVCGRMKPNDVLALSFGEPECRSIFPVAPDPEKRIDLSVQRYENFFAEVKKLWPGELAYLTCVPAHPRNVVNKSPDWPIAGTPEERYRWQAVFYERMRAMCERNGIVFLDACSPFISESGFMDEAIMDDAAHVKYEFRSVYLDLFDDAFGFMTDEKAADEAGGEWDGSREHYETLVKAIVKRIAQTAADPDYEHLVSTGALDSLGLVEFISELEKTFQCRIELLEVSRNDFESISGIFERFIKPVSKNTKRGDTIKLIIGGRQPVNGWKVMNATPAPHVDFVGGGVNLSGLPDESVSELYACYVLQRYDFNSELMRALKEWHRVLTPGGQVYISVPDMNKICYLYLNPSLDGGGKFQLMRLLFGRHASPAEYYQTGFSIESLQMFLTQTGFINIRERRPFALLKDETALTVGGMQVSLNVSAEKRAVSGMTDHELSSFKQL